MSDKPLPSLPQEGFVMTRQTFEGPLPPPEQLKAYEKVQPGISLEILELAKEAQKHSIYIERQDMRRALLNLIFNFILGLIGQIGSIAITLGGYYMAYYYIKAGEPRLGYLTASIASVVCGYLIWWKTKEINKDRGKKP